MAFFNISFGKGKKNDVHHFFSNHEFDGMVQTEYERLAYLKIYKLHAEAMIVLSHLKLAKTPQVKDLAALRALSRLFSEKFQYHPLDRYLRAQSHQDVYKLYVESFFENSGRGESWRRELLTCIETMHGHELLENPGQWAIEWNPDDIPLHQAKCSLLPRARLRTLTKLFIILTQREVDLLEMAAEVDEDHTHVKNSLWQSLEDTKVMQEMVVHHWCRHPRLPRDYVEMATGRTPHEQLEFLSRKKAGLIELCAQDDQLSVDASAEEKPKPESAAFSLYS
jgi:hypothetical protein